MTSAEPAGAVPDNAPERKPASACRQAEERKSLTNARNCNNAFGLPENDLLNAQANLRSLVFALAF